MASAWHLNRKCRSSGAHWETEGCPTVDCDQLGSRERRPPRDSQWRSCWSYLSEKLSPFVTYSPDNGRLKSVERSPTYRTLKSSHLRTAVETSEWDGMRRSEKWNLLKREESKSRTEVKAKQWRTQQKRTTTSRDCRNWTRVDTVIRRRQSPAKVWVSLSLSVCVSARRWRKSSGKTKALESRSQK